MILLILLQLFLLFFYLLECRGATFDFDDELKVFRFRNSKYCVHTDSGDLPVMRGCGTSQYQFPTTIGKHLYLNCYPFVTFVLIR